MKLSLVQANSHLAHFEKNKQNIINHILKSYEEGAELVVFSEASLFGYHPYDLLERSDLITQQLKALKDIVNKIPKGLHVIIGGFSLNKAKTGRPFFNTAFLCTHKKVVKEFHKQLLPTGDVFDEGRFIQAGKLQNNFFKLNRKKILVTICEDIWAWPKKNQRSEYVENPLRALKKENPDLIINISASPFYLNKLKDREFVAAETAKFFKAPLVYVNQVGAQDEVIYDGSSFVLNKKGQMILKLDSFGEDNRIYNFKDTDFLKPIKTKADVVSDLRKALVLGIKDYATKSGIKQVHLGLSGGIDSAVVAALAVEAMGAENVKAFALPTKFNLRESHKAAENLAGNLKIALKTISIEDIFQFVKTIIDKELTLKEFSLVHENLQARIRGLILMAYSNATNSLLLTTGNKSEYATGYATLYGDMCGGLAVLGDLLKHQVYDLAKDYNKMGMVIPEFIITRAPSAELKPDQKDQDSLPPYDQLDKAVKNIVELKQSAKSETEKWLVDRLMKSEFKRWQSAPVLKVSSHSFGRGRRYPLAHKGLK